eukprot:SAG22_NODE_806_length_7087_cov_11.682885_2_plen_144_part_00
MSLGGLLTMISFNPFHWLTGAYSVAFGVMIVGAEFNIERVLKYMAFLRGFLGKGAFFLYLGLPLVQSGWQGACGYLPLVPDFACDSKAAGGAPAGGGGSSNTIFTAENTTFILFFVGLVLVINGVINICFSFTVRECSGALYW